MTHYLNLSLFTEPGVRIPWNEEEKSVVLSYFQTMIKTNQVPRKADCEECINRSAGALSRRDWKHVKFFVTHRIRHAD